MLFLTLKKQEVIKQYLTATPSLRKSAKIHESNDDLLLERKENLMDYFKRGQLELDALVVSVGSTFRTNITCLKTEREMMLICKWRKLFMAL